MIIARSLWRKAIVTALLVLGGLGMHRLLRYFGINEKKEG